MGHVGVGNERGASLLPPGAQWQRQGPMPLGPPLDLARARSACHERLQTREVLLFAFSFPYRAQWTTAGRERSHGEALLRYD